MAKYLPNANVNDGTFFYGFAKAYTFVRAMYKAGKNPTRAGLMRALTSFNEAQPVPAPGAKIKTAPTDRFMHLVPAAERYTAALWTPIGPGARRSAARLAQQRHLQGSWGPATAPTSFSWTSPSPPSRS